MRAILALLKPETPPLPPAKTVGPALVYAPSALEWRPACWRVPPATRVRSDQVTLVGHSSNLILAFTLLVK